MTDHRSFFYRLRVLTAASAQAALDVMTGLGGCHVHAAAASRAGASQASNLWLLVIDGSSLTDCLRSIAAAEDSSEEDTPVDMGEMSGWADELTACDDVV